MHFKQAGSVTGHKFWPGFISAMHTMQQHRSTPCCTHISPHLEDLERECAWSASAPERGILSWKRRFRHTPAGREFEGRHRFRRSDSVSATCRSRAEDRHPTPGSTYTQTNQARNDSMQAAAMTFVTTATSVAYEMKKTDKFTSHDVQWTDISELQHLNFRSQVRGRPFQHFKHATDHKWWNENSYYTQLMSSMSYSRPDLERCPKRESLQIIPADFFYRLDALPLTESTMYNDDDNKNDNNKNHN